MPHLPTPDRSPDPKPDPARPTITSGVSSPLASSVPGAAREQASELSNSRREGYRFGLEVHPLPASQPVPPNPLRAILRSLPGLSHSVLSQGTIEMLEKWMDMTAQLRKSQKSPSPSSCLPGQTYLTVLPVVSTTARKLEQGEVEDPPAQPVLMVFPPGVLPFPGDRYQISSVCRLERLEVEAGLGSDPFVTPALCHRLSPENLDRLALGAEQDGAVYLAVTAEDVARQLERLRES